MLTYRVWDETIIVRISLSHLYLELESNVSINFSKTKKLDFREISYFVTFSRKSYFFLAKTCLTMKTKVNFCFPQLQSHEVLMLIICARPAESGIYHTQHTLSENRGGIHHCSW